MNPCPKCYSENVYDAVICRDCKTPLKSATPTCQNGHQMNETWTECAYCRAEGRLSTPENAGYRATSFEGITPPPPPLSTPPPPPLGAVRTTKWEDPLPPPRLPTYQTPTMPEHRPEPRRVDSPLPFQAAGHNEPPQRRTIYTPVETLNPVAAESNTKPANQKIIGILITYTWDTAGQIFPIREGRNRIGRDSSQCDIAISQDDTLSSLHSSITFRKKFVISDLDSMSGTYVNGEPVEEQFYPLENYAEIRTGSTVWTFIMLDPEKPAAA